MIETNITKLVIETLCKKSKDFNRFFEYHFLLQDKKSLIPKIVRGKPVFKEETFLVQKKLTFEEKLRYYEEDINEFNKRKQIFPNKKIVLRYELI
jgi:acetone carboxylase gamma subunit